MTDLPTNHIMIDLETTGTNPGRNAIIQIAGYKFNPMGAIDPQPFNRCMHVPAWRSWDESCKRDFWGRSNEMKAILQQIMSRMEDPKTVLEDFVDWCCEVENPILWAKPTHFEYPFLQTYMSDFNCLMPFHYRHAQDMNTFIRAIYFPEPPKEILIDFDGPAHDAVYDTLHQVQVVMAHCEELKKRHEAMFRLEQLDK